jgi:alpha,alpha-trehalose-phosphate synthase [UDP-forming]
MEFFRVRLILALIAGVTLVSVGSTYFDVLAHKHTLRTELERRTGLMGMSLAPQVEQALAANQADSIGETIARLRSAYGALGLAVVNTQGRQVAASAPKDILEDLPASVVRKTIAHGANVAYFGHDNGRQWLEDAIPLREQGQMSGALIVLEDAEFIHAEGMAVWRRSFWRIAAVSVLIVAVTLLMVSLFLTRPLRRFTDRLRRLRMGHAADETEDAHRNPAELSILTPLAREVETLAESLVEARAAAQAEARLREAGEHLWTAERLAVHVRERFGSSRIFVVSNREPYMHVRQGREAIVEVPPSGLVTAIEPVLRACDGVWVAHGSGNEDRTHVDEFDRLRVPPDNPRYTLRRVWLSEEEEAGYYDGFANEGLWPLCHIAHTRPIFRAADWSWYQEVNKKFADAVLTEMEGSANPVVLIQDYHFALAPRMVKDARPDARVAIFWHIPWPNPEAFGICPWQAELLDGLLGADLIGFHIPLHCNNFLSTVDRVLEARTDREHMTARRGGHLSAVRPYPVSVAMNSNHAAGSAADSSGWESRAEKAGKLLQEHGVHCEYLALGVDRLDYTKGIVERLLAIEQLLELHPTHRERLTMVQIAAPSRTRIPSYADLRSRVEETVKRINLRFQTAQWRPIVLIERQVNHEEIDRWYGAAEVCLVTSLHDGMNLVAKEFLAARDDEDGVLVLSKFTGAAVELNDALLVNPYDIDGVAEAIHAGLEMNRAERRARMMRMRRKVMEYNAYRWAASLLGDLRELRIENSEEPVPARVRPTIVAAGQGERRKLA